MVDLANNEINNICIAKPIKSITVYWFVEGKGLFKDVQTALSHQRPIQPVPVAVAEDGFYEIIPPEVTPDAS